MKREVDVLDPAVRQAAQMGAPVAVARETMVESVGQGIVRGGSLEELLPALVRRIAWAGDRHRGSVRMELGAGAYAGTTIVVHAEGGRVRVEIGGSGREIEQLRERLDARLRRHGLDVDAVT
ncbi:MAG: hypothetical protein KF819_16800 [Labilithrix sp.]|nr:hypothetical protein [Labilithrix sp.]